MTSEVATYLQTVKQHEAAKRKASELLEFISLVSQATRRDIRSFAGWQYSISLEPGNQRAYDENSHFDMSKWPTNEDIRNALSEWNNADTQRRAAWNAVPQEDRPGLTPPPSDMKLYF